MNPFLHHLLYFLKPKEKYQERSLRAVIVYQFLVICMGVFFLAASVDYILGIYWLGVLSTGWVCLFLGLLYMHYKGFYHWITSIAIIAINFLIFIHDAFYGVLAGVSYFFFPLLFAVFSTITFKNKNFFYFHLLLTIICWFTTEITEHSLLLYTGFSVDTLHKVHIFCMVLALIATLCFVYFIFAQIRHNAVIQERERLKKVVDNNNQYIILVDTNRKIELFNKRFYDFYREEYHITLEAGKDYISYIHPYNLVGFEEGFRNAMTGTIFQKDILFQKSTETTWMTAHFVPISNKDNEVVSVAISLLDISERKNFERSLQETNNKLQQANQELDQFIYRSSHDMRTPIASTMGLLDLLEDEADETERQSYIALIHKNTYKLDQLLIDIAQYVKIKHQKIASTSIHFPGLVQTIVNDIKQKTKDDTIHFQLDIRQTDTFYSDEERIRSIITHLVSNAVAYRNTSIQSQISLTVDVSDKVKIFIKDNGIGIEEEYQHKIFDMFFKASIQSTGSGLGLYTVKEAVRTLGGFIHMQSVAGAGTSFMVEIPNQKIFRQPRKKVKKSPQQVSTLSYNQ
ncbi:PAS domain-containing sensor histidine kinase [Xanthocytophaga flava]|uniref:PAS domain-containing sensor histidine kinase n=1 Tax=Xanthocytophaga flava TaxID=3048013 RepID=UPI0028D26C5E|nr:PAS domain-containing sensor histidine kinase [Xanthocytophaga flavus]MDJ1470499.1 PAS domain-containing sensor histidine kinase [Xanthocytophaga flavus]